MTPDDPNLGPADRSPLPPPPQVPQGSQLSVVPDYGAPNTVMAPQSGAAWLEEPDASEGIRFSSLLHSLRRRWLMATGWGIFVATIVAAILWLVIPENYEAVAYLRVRREQDEILGKPKYSGSDKSYEIYKQTQKDLITGPIVINAALRKEGISNLPMLQGEDNAVEWLMDELSAMVSPETQMIQIKLKGPDDEQPVKIIDALVDAYMREIVQVERDEQNQILDTLNQMLLRSRLDYEQKQTRFRELAQESLAVADDESTELAQRMAMQDLSELGRKKERVEEEFRTANSEYQMARAAIQTGRRTPSDFMIDDELESDYEYFEAKQQLKQLEDQYEYYSGLARPGSASLRRLGTQILIAKRELEKLREEKKPRIIARIRRRIGSDDFSSQAILQPLAVKIKTLHADVGYLQKEYDKKREDFQALSKASVTLLTMKKDLEQLEEFIGESQTRANELNVNLSKPPRVTLMQKAIVPESSDWRMKWLEVGGAWVFVFGLTVVGIALWDYQGKRVNTTKDIEGPGTGLRVVGSLPMLDGHGGGMWPFSSRMDHRALEVVLNFSMDSIRAALLYNRSSEKIKTVMITSALGQEGRSTVASQLAVSMARSGLRTVLVDADVRNPQQHLVFGVDGSRGFCELLRGALNVDQSVQATAVDQLWVMPAGRYDLASTQAISSEKAKALFGELRSRYDFVVVDVGPVLTSADALLVGQHVDTALLSVLRDVSQIPKIYAACDRLRSVGVHVMGSVVNGAGTEIRSNELNVATEAQALPEPEPQMS